MIRFEIKLMLIFVVFFLAVVGLVLFMSLQTERKLINEVEKDLRNLVRTVHFSTQKLSTERGADFEALERFIEEAKRNKSVREVSVVGSSEKVIASSNPMKVGQHHALGGQEIVVREELGSAEPGTRQIHYEVKIPLMRNNQVIGLVQTSLVLDDYRYLLRHLYVKNLFVAAGIMLFAFGAVFFVLNRINRPLRHLTAAAEQVASGDLTIQLPGRSQDEVGRLTAAFNEMTQKLSERQHLEDKLHSVERRAMVAEMASSFAHEIRNPLNLINLTADHLSQQFPPEREDRQKAYQELILGLKTEVRHLNQMVNEFLNIGRPTRLKKNRIPLADLFEHIQGALKNQLASKGITLECPDLTGLWITADQEQMRLVLLNLLLNAIEAVPENGRIAVQVEQRESRREVLISIVDNGPGVAPDDLPRIFEPYFTKRQNGVGLGLALVRRIVEEHGGRIQVRNEPGGGARFEIALPSEV
jgi:nitrogen fixation/metabolism regulation signal transduction histidine kinase